MFRAVFATGPGTSLPKQRPAPLIPIQIQRDLLGRSQRWRIVGIGLGQQSRPSLIKHKSLLEANDAAAALALAMYQPRRRNTDDRQAELAHAKTEIDVVVVVRKHGVESAHLLEDIFADRQTGAGHGRDIASRQQPGPKLAARRVPADVADAIPDTRHNPGVLQRRRGVPQDGAGDADLLRARAARSASLPSRQRSPPHRRSGKADFAFPRLGRRDCSWRRS